MRIVGLSLALCALALNAAAAPAATPSAAKSTDLSRAVAQGQKAGFRDCGPAMDMAVKFVHDDDASYAHFGRWSSEAPNDETFTSLTSATFQDGKSLTAFTGTKNARGKCSVGFTQFLIIPDKICSTLRKEAFAGWKEYGELGADKIYEDPTSPNADVVLVPVGQTGCVIVKTFVGFGMDTGAQKATPAKK